MAPGDTSPPLTGYQDRGEWQPPADWTNWQGFGWDAGPNRYSGKAFGEFAQLAGLNPSEAYGKWQDYQARAGGINNPALREIIPVNYLFGEYPQVGNNPQAQAYWQSIMPGYQSAAEAIPRSGGLHFADIAPLLGVLAAPLAFGGLTSLFGGAAGAGAGAAGAAAPAAAGAAGGSGAITGISNIASALASGATPAIGAGAGEALGLLGGAGSAFGVGPGLAIPATGAAFGAAPLSAMELANVAQGINAFAAPSMPAGSYQAQTGQLPQGAPSGGGPGGGTGLQAPPNAQFGTQGLSPAGQQALGLPPTGPTVPSAAGAPAGVPGTPTGIPGGTDVVSDIINQLKKNALSLGLMGASLLGAGAKADELPPAAGEVQAQTQGARDLAQQYIAAAQQGKLTGPQQASLDQYVQNAKNQVRQYFAGIGQFDSTSRLQAEAEIDRTALAMQQQIISTTLDQGLKALQIGVGPLQNIANYQAGQDQALIQAMGQFAQGIGGLFGQQAGKGTTTT